MDQVNRNSLKIWCLLRDQFAHVKPVEENLGEKAEFIYDGTWDPQLMLRQNPDLVLCVNDYPYEIARCLDAAREAKIPSLVLQDGILEWRCQYENPLFGAGGGGPQHQPVLADKIACIGYQSACHIAAWGNADKVEVAGMPRLDYLLQRDVPPVTSPGRRILVMTAKTPGFTPEQEAITLRSLMDLKAFWLTRSDVEVIWRVSQRLVPHLEIDNELQQFSSVELADILETVDAVIITPSTAILEAMLLKRPVAALDYHNVPRFVPTAWTISASEHIPPVIEEILHPPARKIAFQNECLKESLECEGPAAPRVTDLIDIMIAVARKARETKAPLTIPKNLLGYNKQDFTASELTLADFYPDNLVFSNNELQSLQVRLARLQKENEFLYRKLQSHGINYWINAVTQRLRNYKNRKTTKNA